MWWSDDRKRARDERAAFHKLWEENPWLEDARFRHGDDLELCVDVDITHGGETFPLTLFYPTAFPDIPPIVKSRAGKQLSKHQYGADGELCLQYRPENWDQSVTGAMMIESARNLIVAERPLEGEAVPVPNAQHRISLGAELRVESWRMTVPPDAWEAIDRLWPEAVMRISVDEVARYPTCVASLVGIGDHDSHWSSHQPEKAGAARESGCLFRTQSDMGYLIRRGEWTLKDLCERVPGLGDMLPDAGHMHLIVQDAKNRRTALKVLRRRDGKLFLLPYRLIDEAAAERRNASNRAANTEKRVAIIGCGSIGSKVAVSLARSGVRKFVLVDEDVFLTENLVRNDLDAMAVGWHKAEAVRERIGGVVSEAEVDVQKLRLGGEGTARYLEAVVDAIGECDLIVDASADPNAFNLCGATAKRLRVPMVWGRVYAGGIGGIVARARPDVDPPPIDARNQISVWYEDQNAPAVGEYDQDYAARGADGTPFIADDADVGVIAAHLARFAIDTLQPGEESAFPYSAYVIGLAQGWIFSQPFEVHPIDLIPTGAWLNTSAVSETSDLRSLLRELTEPMAE